MPFLMHLSRYLKGHKQAIPEQAYYRPREFKEVEGPRFRDSRCMKVVTLFSPTHQPPLTPPQEILLVLISVKRSYRAKGKLKYLTLYKTVESSTAHTIYFNIQKLLISPTDYDFQKKIHYFHKYINGWLS